MLEESGIVTLFIPGGTLLHLSLYLENLNRED